ncbi:MULTISPECIES: exosortase F system-associated membrane protein [Aequorivita]|uniref:Exosortase F system-associated protein n=1 Tax=Aequorivita iocasae TaxID=2803865 RepID=A0ABX7DU28_9FLAO|nr:MULTISPECIES: exosortase F system-associated protein [Aequorivita]QQX77027.1 exosortase F system-associated protein [Aequorivita iocasae]UCA56506.1 exosortase F system-associated protein [Aequorivita sp. F7]
MKRTLKIFGFIILAGLLVLIRTFENSLFYDPLLLFFEMDYKSMPLPKMDTFALQTGIALRFLLNTIISLAILWLVFKDREIIKLSLILYSILFAILFMAFSFIIFTSEESSGHFVLFYVRRFLIQPLLLLILLPAFYFQKYKSS